MRENVVSYKYDYPAKKSSGLYVNKKKGLFLVLSSVFFIYLAYHSLKDGAWFFFVLLFIAWIVSIFAALYLSGKKRLYLTPRYLLCGDDVIYYRNIIAIKVEDPVGRLTIQTPNTILTLSRDNFPTNARKDHKIIKNKEEKFRKVSEKIIKRVKATNPSFMINAPAEQNRQPAEQPIQQAGQPSGQTRVRDLSRY